MNYEELQKYYARKQFQITKAVKFALQEAQRKSSDMRLPAVKRIAFANDSKTYQDLLTDFEILSCLNVTDQELEILETDKIVEIQL